MSESRYAAAIYHGRLDPAPPDPSPFDLDALAALQATLLFGEDDVRYLRMSRGLLEPQVDAILDTWYGFVGSTPHLLAYFSTTGGEPLHDYLAAVRVRFGRWILDTADARYDADWLAYQHEIGRRHHRVRKNRVDGAAASDHIPLRYVIALVVPIVTTLRPFLEAGGHSAEDVQGMHQAWHKSVLMQVILWSHPYVRDGEL